MTKYLFMCREGQKRSPMAAEVAREIAQERDRKIEMHFGPVPETTPNPLIQRHLGGYDKIFVMESWMARRVRDQGYEGKLVNLRIGDNGYAADDPRLRATLRNRLKKFV